MKEIRNIIFYSSNKDNIYTEQACIFYSDGSVESVTKDKGIDATLEFAKKEGIKYMSSLKSCKNIQIMTEKDFEKHYDKILLDSLSYNKKQIQKKQEEIKDNEKKKDNNKDNQNTKQKENNIKKEKAKVNKPKKTIKKTKKKKSKLKKLWLGIKIGLGVTCAVVIGKGVKFVHDLFTPNNNYNKESNNDSTNLNTTTNSTESSNKVSELLSKNTINEKKRIFITKTWSYLQQYNETFSNKHIENNKSSKLAHTWDEIVVQQLLYNKYSRDDLTKIFGTYDFDSEIMYNAYKKAIKQETQAHIVQTSSFEKQNLINNEKGKKFYMKYESLIISFNIQTNSAKKEEIAKEFYSELRKDFNLKEKDIKNIEDYKLSITPIVNAMNKMCKNLDKDYVLNEKELSYFNSDVLFEKALNKLEKANDTLYTYRTASKAVGDEEALSFETFEDAAMDEVDAKGIYNVSDKARDISDHKEYKERVNWKYNKSDVKEKTSQQNEKQSTESKKSNNNGNKNSKQEQKQDKDKKDSNNKNKETTDNKTTASPDNTENSSDIDNDENIGRDDSEDSNEIDNSSSEDVDTTYDDSDAAREPEETETPNKDDYNTDDSITDITADPTGAVDSNEPLPDPNITTQAVTSSSITEDNLTNEEKADKIIAEMENVAVEENSNAKVLTK